MQVLSSLAKWMRVVLNNAEFRDASVRTQSAWPNSWVEVAEGAAAVVLVACVLDTDEGTNRTD